MTSLRAEPLDTTVEIETPEHVRFRHDIVGPSRRALAYLADTAVRGLLFVAIAAPLGLLNLAGSVGAGVFEGLSLVVLFSLEWGYFAVFEAFWSGRTPGKKWVGLRVIRDDGLPIHGTAAVLRNLLRAADFLPALYGLGLVVMGSDSKFRRLGDLAAGTIVIAETRRHRNTPYVLHPAPSADELAWVGARPPVSAQELQTIDLLLRRARRLSPQRATELAAMIAPIYADRLGLQVTDPVRLLGLLHFRATGAKKRVDLRGRR